MINAEVLPDGNLKLTPDQEWLDEHGEEDEILTLWNGMEHYWANGSYWPFSAGDANPFVGLTDAPCIAEDMSVMDDGVHVLNGRLWAFMNYMVQSPIQLMHDEGFVIFTLVK